MDNIAHTLAGLAVRDVAPKSLFKSKPFFWVALVVANIPDIDIIGWFFGQDFYFHIHRGITHSLFVVPFWGAIGAIAAYYISKKSLPFLKTWLWYCFIVFVHLFLDWVTSYGTELLAPLSDRTFSAHLFPIVDIWVLIPLFFLLLVGRYFSEYRRKAALIVIAVLVLYAGFRVTMKFRAETMVRNEKGVAERIMSFADIESWRTWLNPSMYRVVTLDGDSAVSYEVAVIGGRIAEQGRFELFSPQDPLWEEVSQYRMAKSFLKRSDLPVYAIREGTLLISDLKYTSDVGNSGSLTLAIPFEEGEVIGEPRFLRPEREYR
jgi:inner membrane protein